MGNRIYYETASSRSRFRQNNLFLKPFRVGGDLGNTINYEAQLKVEVDLGNKLRSERKEEWEGKRRRNWKRKMKKTRSGKKEVK